MRAGRMDRRIVIEHKTTAQNDHGEEVDSWSALATVWAEKIENRGQERFAAPQFIGKSACTFRVRWSETVKAVTSEHRITLDGRSYDIQDVREIGRRQGIELDCTVRSEEPLDA